MYRWLLQRQRVHILWLVFIAGCDALAPGDYQPAYFSLTGTIVGATNVTTPRDVRIALLWQNDHSGGSNYAVQVVSVEASFPADFRLDVAKLPPPDVLYALSPADASLFGGLIDSNIRWAVGWVVVYADDNGNGQLDVVAPGETPRDRVLAVASDVDLFYLASGQPAPLELAGIFPVQSGFSLVREPPRRDPLPGECGGFDSFGHWADLCDARSDTLPGPIAAEHAMDLTLVDDAALGRFACSTFWGPFEYPDFTRATAGQICDGGACPYCRGYACPLDLPPAGVTVRCNGDGTAYVYKTCSDEPSLCGTRFCHFGHGERQPQDPLPPGWPCP
jgi:hypothetical protein